MKQKLNVFIINQNFQYCSTSIESTSKMGSWKLEAGKMFLYLFFPVGSFIIFSHPKFYEKSLQNIYFEISKDIDYEGLEALENFQRLLASLDNIIEELESQDEK